MRFAINASHRDFFRKNSFIEFDELLPFNEIGQLKEAFDEVLAKRLQKLPETRNPRELFMASRNIWKDNHTIEKVSLSHKFGEIVANLFDQRIVRFAFDQLLCTKMIPGVVFPTADTLQDISCFQPILGGLILRLTEDPHPPDFFPRQVGNGVFFNSSYTLPLPAFFQVPNQTFLLIVYAPEKSLYLLEKNDPHTHAPKREGYVFGDLLRTPVLYK